VQKFIARLRAARRSVLDSRADARREAAGWPDPWAEEWIEGVIRAGTLAGLDAAGAVQLLRDARVLFKRIAGGADSADRASRVDLAAKVLGSSRALDWGTGAEAAVTRALSLQFGGDGRQA
jgi:hypothetical protein